MTPPDLVARPARTSDRDIGLLWSLVLGGGMILVGLLGFVPNPLVGDASSAWGSPISLTGHVRNVIHLVTGAVLLYAALGLTYRRRGWLLVAVGVVQLVMVLLGLVSGDMFGALRYHVSALDQVVLLAVALANVAIGFVATGGSLRAMRRS